MSSRRKGAPSSSSSGKGTSISLSFDSNLRSSLAHLPPSMYHALVGRDIPPQSLVLQVTRNGGSDDAAAAEADQRSDSDDDEADQDTKPRNTIYLGWSGQCSNVEYTLTLSASLKALFQPASDPSVSYTLTLLRSPPLPTATRVDLTPLTTDDWELLSQNAGAVEDNMLSQVRGLHRGARVCIFVGRGGSQECWFRVDSTDPQTTKATTGTKSLPRAVRLVKDTEIVIAPKVRQTQAEAIAKEQHAIGGSQAADFPSSQSVNTKLAARSALKYRIYKVLPANARPAQHDQQYDLDGDTPIAIISGGQDSQEWSLLATAFASSSSASTSWLKATIQIQACPSAPAIRPWSNDDLSNDSQSSAPSSSSSHQATTTAFVLPSTSPQDSRWVWFNTALKKKLGGTVGLGETFCFSAPPPGSNTTTPPASLTASSDDVIPAPPTQLAPRLAGVTSLLSTLGTQISTTISTSSLLSSSFSTSSHNLLLYGSSGTGKTSLLHYLCSLPTLIPLYIDCTPYSEYRISQLKDVFCEWRNALDWYAQGNQSGSQQQQPRRIATVLMLDNLDRVVIPQVENVDPTRARTIAELFVQYLQGGASQEQTMPKIIVATANSNSSMHKLLVEKHFWNESLQVKPPGKSERAEILAHLVKLKVDKSRCSNSRNSQESTSSSSVSTSNAALTADASLNYIQLSSQTEGYLPADLVDLVDRAIYRSAMRSSASPQSGPSPLPTLTLKTGDFHSAQENFTPLSLRSLSLSTSSVSWSSIGGLVETRRVLRETLEFPSRYSQIFASCPLRLRSGLLLYGYPGCGKTMLASAVAKECGANFVSVKGPEILNKYIGASEKSIRDLFDRASSAKPCVLFFDEFDSIAPKRGHDSTGVTDRVVNQLLTQMDGAEGLDGVYVLAATSRPDLIDSALLRPGRLDKSLLCGMPDESDRKEILQAVVREGKIHLDDDVEWDQWVRKLDGYSGADLQAFVYNAHLEAVHQGINNAVSADKQEKLNNDEDGAQTQTKAPLQFIELNRNPNSKDPSPSTSTRSGAEEQALRRRIEMALANSKSKRQADSVKNEAATSAAAAAPRTHNPNVVTNAHLQQSLAAMRPSVPPSELKRLERIYREFAGERSTEFKSGEGSREVGARESLM